MADDDSTTSGPTLEAEPGGRRDDGDDRGEQRAAALRDLQAALLGEIDGAVAKLERARPGETAREHLEILRSLLRAQVTAYLEHFIDHRATLFSQTSVMYAGEVGVPGVISTTFRGLLEAGTLTGPQGALVARYVSERRTVIIFGDRATGKSTLLNALFELVPVDDRFVAVERGPDLPALKERSFCVRLEAGAGADLPALFAKARRMDPARLVVGEMHAAEVREFFAFLADQPRVGGLATVRAETARKAVDAMLAAIGGDAARARELVAAVRPALVHMHSDENGLPRAVAIWSVDGMDAGEITLREVRTGAAADELLAET